MADLNFACPHCHQNIACDELWSGHEIQCPTCQGTLTVPAAQAAPAPSAPGKARLASNAQKPAATGNRNIPIRNLAAPPAKKQSPLIGILYDTIVVAALGAGGYYGYNWYSNRQSKEAASDQTANAASPAADTNQPPGSSGQDAPAAPPPKPPSWTLEVAGATIPEGAVNGSISGTNFLAEAARIDPVGPAQVLRFYQGQVTSPDREVLVYLYLKPGEKLGGQSLVISNQMRSGPSVPQVAKRWKVAPQYAPTLKSFNSGYAMKLELGKAGEDGTLPGKIFLALPDPEKTVVAGVFTAAVTPADPNAQMQQYQQSATPAPQGGPDRSAMERRYGIRR